MERKPEAAPGNPTSFESVEQAVESILGKIPHHREIRKFALGPVDPNGLEVLVEALKKNEILNSLNMSVNKREDGNTYIRVSWEHFPTQPTIWTGDSGKTYMRYTVANNVKVDDPINPRLEEAIFG